MNHAAKILSTLRHRLALRRERRERERQAEAWGRLGRQMARQARAEMAVTNG